MGTTWHATQGQSREIKNLQRWRRATRLHRFLFLGPRLPGGCPLKHCEQRFYGLQFLSLGYALASHPVQLLAQGVHHLGLGFLDLESSMEETGARMSASSNMFITRQGPCLQKNERGIQHSSTHLQGPVTHVALKRGHKGGGLIRGQVSVSRSV